ncbi:MAG: hypothetical protein H0U71_03225 [Gammaproteobacteria bacterium]|nr:hypothetical protein [Gammaproteobacteria bacterium]
MVRIYYPAIVQNQPRVSYYPPYIKSQQQILSHIPNISKEQIEQLNKIKSYSVEKAPVVGGKIFPVILFSPGLR